VTALHRDAKQGHTSALKRLVHFLTSVAATPFLIFVQVEIRDVPICPVTKQPLREEANSVFDIQGQVGVRSELAQIIPFSLQYKVS
jgi:hypothetical protein